MSWLSKVNQELEKFALREAIRMACSDPKNSCTCYRRSAISIGNNPEFKVGVECERKIYPESS